jgi:hypothetical protein
MMLADGPGAMWPVIADPLPMNQCDTREHPRMGGVTAKANDVEVIKPSAAYKKAVRD